jgi:uncharacterized protein (DUF1810 family)
MDDPHDLQRFADAQRPVYDAVLAELSAGAKTSHWMWFVFPQLRALGRSATARRFGLAGLQEAEAYWRHPLLGPRLRDCTVRVLGAQGRSVLQIFGPIDAMKFRSSMTLFERAAPREPVFRAALDHCFEGRADERTLELL